MFLITRPACPSVARLGVALLLCAPLALSGCHVDTRHNGGNNDVDVGVPFGSVHVHTDADKAAAGLGLTPYPGATRVRGDGQDSGSADVNLSFGNFKLGVHAEELQTADPQDKVIGFYRKDMARFGTVIACRGNQPVGSPTHTADGLTCTSDNHNGGSEDELELRTGSPLHQHVVGLSAQNGGTRIGLVALDLPDDAKHGPGQQE